MGNVFKWMIIIFLLIFLAACGAEETGENVSGDNGEGENGNETYTLKYNHVLSEQDPFHDAFLNWADRVDEQTDGGLQIEVHHSAQLGVEEDIIEQLKEGSNVGQNTDSGRLAQYVPEIAVMNAPYFMDGVESIEQLRELPVVQEWMDRLENEHGIKVLSFNWVQGKRHVLSNNPVTSPSDLDGERLRTPGAPIWQESVEAIGATPVAMDFGEVYTGIQQGSVDGAELVYPNITGGSLYEVADNLSETGHITLINFQVVGAEFFNSLPEDYQQILVGEANKAGAEVSETIREQSQEIKQQVMDEGMTVVEEAEIDMEAFKEAGNQAYEELDLTEVREKVYSQLEEQ